MGFPRQGRQLMGSFDQYRSAASRNVLAALCVIEICLLASQAFGLNPSRRISQYAHTAWRLQEGYLNGTPTAIAQTTDGYIWIATQNTLFRFDGVRFVPWKPPPGQQLRSPTINALTPDHNGGLWIGTTNGLAHWTGSTLTAYQPTGRINSVLVTEKNEVWVTRSRIGDHQGPLCKVVADHLKCYGKGDGIPIVSASPLSEDSQHNLWIGSTASLVSWRPGVVGTYPLPGLRAAEGLSGVEALAVAPDNSLWVGVNRPGKGLGLERFANGQWYSLSIAGFDSTTLKVTALLLDHANTLWIGTSEDGVYRVHGNDVDHINSTNGLSGDTINGFLEDREGNLWVATTRGADNFRDLPIATISKEQGLSSDNAASVIAAPDGTVWVGNIGSLDAIRNSRVTSIRGLQGLPGQQITSMLVDHLGRLWLGIDNALYIYEKGHFTPVPGLDNGPVGFVESLTEDSDHQIWIQAHHGKGRRLLRIENGRVREEVASSLAPDSPYVVADPRGGIWLTPAAGVALFRNGHLESHPFNHMNFGRASAPRIDPDGSVWVSSRFGLASLHNGKWELLSDRNGLPCNQVYTVIKDLHGSLWLYAECGLIEIKKAELERWLNDPQAHISVQSFDVYDGAQPSPATFAPASTRSPDGRLWFDNDTIVQVIDPDSLGSNPLAPPVHIEQVTTAEKEYSPIAQLRLPPHTRDLRIDYTALSFVAPQRVRFRVKLEGYDSQWRDVGTQRAAFYTNLRPGGYTFSVRACNNDGVWNDDSATLSFVIVPTWYQTMWFRLLCLFLGAALCYVLYVLRLRQHENAMRVRFGERLEERTRIARELHDTLLQTIQGSMLVADQARTSASDLSKTQRLLDQLYDWLGRASVEGRTALESLRASEARDLVEALRSIVEECRVHSDIDFSLTVTGPNQEIVPSVRDELYWIGYEGIRNACKHSGARHVRIDIIYSRDFELRIQDDGKGIPEDTLRTGKAGHFGLRGMQERAARIGAKITLSSSPQVGTTVDLVVPRNVTFRSPKEAGLSFLPNWLRLKRSPRIR